MVYLFAAPDTAHFERVRYVDLVRPQVAGNGRWVVSDE